MFVCYSTIRVMDVSRWLKWRGDGSPIPLSLPIYMCLGRYTDYLERYTKLATPVRGVTGSQELFGAWACEDVALSFTNFI